MKGYHVVHPFSSLYESLSLPLSPIISLSFSISPLPLAYSLTISLSLSLPLLSFTVVKPLFSSLPLLSFFLLKRNCSFPFTRIFLKRLQFILSSLTFPLLILGTVYFIDFKSDYVYTPTIKSNFNRLRRAGMFV